MRHVEFDGSGFIGFRNFAYFVVDFFSADRTFLTKLFPQFYIVIDVGIIFSL